MRRVAPNKSTVLEYPDCCPALSGLHDACDSCAPFTIFVCLPISDIETCWTPQVLKHCFLPCVCMQPNKWRLRQQQLMEEREARIAARDLAAAQ
eukprot:1106045-Pelagomonas_calceolata.AAC.1